MMRRPPRSTRTYTLFPCTTRVRSDGGSNRSKDFHPSRSGDARWQDLTPAGTNVTAFSISADGSTMALVQGDANTPSDVYLLDLRHPRAEPKRLTRFGDAVHEGYAVEQVEAIRWRSADDSFDRDGGLVKLAGETGRAKGRDRGVK